MDSYNREVLVARIVSGRTYLKIDKKRYCFIEPSASLKLKALERFNSIYQKCQKRGIPNIKEQTEELIKFGLWSKDKEKELSKIEEDIDELKVTLYKFRMKKKESVFVRKNIDGARQKRDELLAEKNQMFFNNAETIANSDKLRFIMGNCLYKSNGKIRVWPGNSYWLDGTELLENSITEYLKNRPSQIQIRELARTEPWRGIWACRDACSSVFSTSASNLSDDQKSLVVWTRIYDNSREDQNGPGEDVIEDDDMFDGWMILRRRGIDSQRLANNKIEGLTDNSKILDSENVMIVCNEEDAQAIYDLNDSSGRNKIASRTKYIEKIGSVDEFNLPDKIDEKRLIRNRSQSV